MGKILLAVVTLCALASAAYPKDCKEDGSCCRPVIFMDGDTKLQGIVFEDLDHALAKKYIRITPIDAIPVRNKKSTKRSRCYVGYRANKKRVVQSIKKKHILKTLYFKINDKVEARWNTTTWYKATIKAHNADGTYKIQYDNGVVRDYLAGRIRLPIRWKINDKVAAKWNISGVAQGGCLFKYSRPVTKGLERC